MMAPPESSGHATGCGARENGTEMHIFRTCKQPGGVGLVTWIRTSGTCPPAQLDWDGTPNGQSPVQLFVNEPLLVCDMAPIVP